MEEQGFLIGLAQLAIVLTGFISVFMIIMFDEAQRSRVQTHHAVSMLVGSIGVVVASLAPIALYFLGFQGSGLWFWSTVVCIVANTAFFVLMMSLTLQLGWSGFKEAGIIHMLVSYGLGWTAAGLLFANLLAEVSTSGLYILALLVMLLVALVSFVTFAVQKVLYW